MQQATEGDHGCRDPEAAEQRRVLWWDVDRTPDQVKSIDSLTTGRRTRRMCGLREAFQVWIEEEINKVFTHEIVREQSPPTC